MDIINYFRKVIIKYLTLKRKKIMKIFMVVLFVIITLKILDTYSYISMQKEEQIEEQIEEKKKGDFTQEDFNNFSETINIFISACENEAYEDAYKMITSESKNILYPNLTDFAENYCKVYFNKNSTYDISFVKAIDNLSIYKIKISQGSIENGSFQKYIELLGIKKENNGKLQVSLKGLIDLKKIEKKYIDSNIEITVLENYIYPNNETIKLRINNRKDKSIFINPEQIECIDGQFRIYKAEKFNINGKIKPNETVEFSIDIDKEFEKYSSTISILFINISDKDIKIEWR